MVYRLISIITLVGLLVTVTIPPTLTEERSSSSLSEGHEPGLEPWSAWNQNTNHLPDSHHYQSTYEETDTNNHVNNEIIAFLGHHYIEPPSSTGQPEDEEVTPPPVPLPVVNRPLQVSLLAVIMLAAVLANGSVILNISWDSLKLRMVHFLLIRHVCITDCLGAILVLPVPLVAVARGNWDFGETMCSAVSTTTAACWTMHLLAVAFYRADRVLAVWLPTGRYPIFSVRTTNILIVIVWCLAVAGSYGATVIFGPTFQPALALCIPDVPLIFFVVVFAGYCIGLVGLTTGYVLAFARRRRRKRRKVKQSNTHCQLQDNAPFEPTPSEYLDEEVEDLDDNNSSSHGPKRRALSDQFPVMSMRTQNSSLVGAQDSPYAHRRTWSESATSLRPSTIFTTLVTKATRHATNNSEKSLGHLSNRNGTPAGTQILPESSLGREDSSSENLTVTSSHGYQRLTEDEVSSCSPSEASTTVPKLVHSVSYDERGLGGSKVDDLSVHRGLMSAQSKSFDCGDSQAQQRINFLRSALLTGGSRNKGGEESGAGCSSSHMPMSLDSSQMDIYSSDLLISPGHLSGRANAKIRETSSSDEPSPDIPPHLLFPPQVTEAQKVGNSTYTNSTYPGRRSQKGRNFKEKSAELNRYFTGVYAWSLDRKSILSRKNSVGVLELPSGDNPCFGESESSGSSVSSLPNNESRLSVDGSRNRPTHTVVHLDPSSLSTAGRKNHLSLNVSVNSLSLCGDGRPPDVNSLTSHAVYENNNHVNKQVVRKHRTRARVKHFRAKGNKSGPAKRALASYAVSVGHLLLYLPAMFVVGLQGSSLPPGVALFCGIVVYCDFLIQPVALLLVSHRLRTEVQKTLRSLFCRCRDRKRKAVAP